MVVSAIIALDIAIVVSSWDVKNFGNKRTSKLGASFLLYSAMQVQKRPRLQYK